MPMNVFELYAKLGLDSTEYESGLRSAGALAGGFMSTLSDIGRAAGEAVKAIGEFAKESVTVGQNFDKSMSQVAATMGKSVSEINELRDFAQEMGATTAFSATQAADALNYMALAGYEAETSMAMLPNVLNLAAAGGIGLAYASDMITDSQSALGLSLDETKELVDKMAQASSKSNTSVSQLGEAILTIGATARSIKGGTTELSAVLGVLADNGIKGAEGGTALRNIIMSLQTPTKAGTEALEKLGMSYADMYDSAGNMRAIPEILLEIQGRMEGMTQASKDAIVGGIFNKFDIRAVNALLGTTSERFEDLTAAIENSTGAAEKMAETQLDNLAGSITLFQSALEGAQIAISDKLSPTLNEFVKFGSQALSELTDAFKNDGIDGAMDVLSEELDKGIEMISGKLPDLISAGGQLIGAVAEGMIKNLPELISGTQGVTVTIAEGIISKLPDVATTSVEIVKTLADGVTKNIPQLLPVAVNAVRELGDGIIKSVPELIKSAHSIVETMADGISDILPVISDTALGIISSLADGVKQSLPQLLPVAVNTIDNLADSLTDPNNLSALLDTGLDLLVTLADGITEALPQLTETAYTIINNVYRFILDPENIAKILKAGMDIAIALGEGLVASVPKVIEAALQITTSIFDKWTNADWKDLGEGADVKIAEAITNNADIVTEAWNGMLTTIDNMLGTSLTDMAKDVEQWCFDIGKQLYNAMHPDTDAQLRSIELSGDIQNAIDEALKRGYDPKEALKQGLSVISSDEYDIYEKYLGGDFTLDKVQKRYDQLVGIAEDAAKEREEAEKRAIREEEEYSRRASYIPTEALRQQAGKAAEPIRLLQEETNRAFTQELNSAVDDTFEAAESTAAAAAERTKDFATKAIGDYTNLGVVEILGHTLDDNEKEADRIASEVYSASQEYANKQTKYLGLTYEDQIELWEKIRGQFVEGSSQYLDAQDKIFDLEKKRDEERKKEEDNRRKDEEKARTEQFNSKKEQIRKDTKFSELSYDEQIKLWEDFLSEYETGSKEYEEIYEKIFDLRKSKKSEDDKLAKEEQDRLEKELDDKRKAYDKYIQDRGKIQEKIDNIEKSYADSLNDRTKEILGSFSLFEKVPERIAVSGADLIDALEGQVEAQRKFYEDIDKLTAAGVSEELVSEIRSQGVGAIDQLDALLDLSPEELAKYDKLYKDKSELAASVAESELAGLKDETDKQIADLYDEMSDLTAENAENIGYHLMEGISKGITENTSLVIDAAKETMKEASEVFGNVNPKTYSLASVTATAATGTVSSESKAQKKETVKTELPITVNVNGIQYQDMNELAKAVSERIKFMIDRGKIGYAGA